jgi:hypothetical protein
MDEWFGRIGGANQLPGSVTAAFRNAGFVVIPGPMAGDAFGRLAAAYDSAMTNGQGSADMGVGSTTTRLHDLVNRGNAFDPLYVHPPLLEACASIIGGPFRLSRMLGRTLRQGARAQELHVDLARDDQARPMVGFILMVDDFRADNGATRFVPGSHRWPEVPENVMPDRRTAYTGEVIACGLAGSVIIFDASIWHGHTANTSDAARRSIQGYFIPRAAPSSFNLLDCMHADTLERLSPLARYVLAA